MQQVPNPNNPFFPVNNNGNVSRFPIQQVPGQGNNAFFPGNNGNNVNNGNVQTTTAAPGTATTASPQFLACMQSCPSTMEYNPVCGTDNVNYHNGGRLSCAQRCGKSKFSE